MLTRSANYVFGRCDTDAKWADLEMSKQRERTSFDAKRDEWCTPILMAIEIWVSVALPRFKGGSVFDDGIEAALASAAFRQVVERDADHIAQCQDCPIRHFCGAPCPAEAFELNGGAEHVGAFCDFYKEQVNYALRLIANGKANDYLWDGWDDGTQSVINITP